MSDSQAISGNEEISWFWDAVDSDVTATLSPDQRQAIEGAVIKSAARSEPADFRLHLGKYFVRIIAGKERRNDARLKQNLKDNPIFARKNLPLLLIMLLLWVPAVLYIVGFVSAVFSNLIR